MMDTRSLSKFKHNTLDEEQHHYRFNSDLQDFKTNAFDKFAAQKN